jgi:hypothetical protein
MRMIAHVYSLFLFLSLRSGLAIAESASYLLGSGSQEKRSTGRVTKKRDLHVSWNTDSGPSALLIIKIIQIGSVRSALGSFRGGLPGSGQIEIGFERTLAILGWKGK